MGIAAGIGIPKTIGRFTIIVSAVVIIYLQQVVYEILYKVRVSLQFLHTHTNKRRTCDVRIYKCVYGWQTLNDYCLKILQSLMVDALTFFKRFVS